METTALLEEKWRVQNELAEMAEYNIKKYAVIIDHIVNKIRNKYKLKAKKNNIKNKMISKI